MGDDSRVAEVIADWQHRLLQLDRRNNLLYFKPGRRAVALLDVTPDEINERLASAKTGLSFAYAERVKWRPDALFELLGDDASGHEEVRIKPGDLIADVEPLDLQRRLVALHRREREWEEEQGLNVLFLAVGFLEWIDEDGETARSPLLLIPCDLIRASPRDPFFLQREDDDAEINATLAHKLRDLGVELPDLDGQAASEYFASVRRGVRRKENWSVTEEVVLSTFAYSKMAMYQDLDRMRTEGVDHPLVLQLAGAKPDASEVTYDDQQEPRALPPDRELAGGKLDDLLELRDQFTVLDADFSQLRAIETSRRGSHLVIHGPPGTGKSQTIANLIATLLADGMRVLFVSEKTAALDVVKRRLEDCDLGIFCLDLHSERGKKSSVYEQLGASLNDSRHIQEFSLSYEMLQSRRDHLNSVVRALHEVRQPLGQTIFQVQGKYAQVQHLPRVEFLMRGVEELDTPRITRLEEVLRRIEVRTEEFREHETSRWLPLKIEQPSVQLPDQLRDDMSRVREAATEVLRCLAPLAEWIGIAVPATAVGGERLADLFEHFTSAPGTPAHWLNKNVSARLLGVAGDQEQRQLQRRALEAEVGRFFGDVPPPTDYRRLASVLDLLEEEQGDLRALLGDQWHRRIVPAPREELDRLKEIEAAGRALVARYAELSSLLGSREIGRISSMKGLSKATALAGRLAKLFPVPPGWLDIAEADALPAELASAKKQLADLVTAEEALAANFDLSVVDSVDEETLIRYRADYQSVWRRWLRGSFRRDQRLLRGHMRVPGKLPLSKAMRAVEQAMAVQRQRTEWETVAPTLRETFGDRFRGRDTDWNRLSSDIEDTVEIARNWRHSGDPLHNLLTNRDALDELGAAMSAAIDARARLEQAAQEIDQPELAHKNTFSGLVERSARAVTLLRKLSDATDDLVGRFRTPPTQLNALVELVDAVIRLEEVEFADDAAAAQLSAGFGDHFAGPDTDWGVVKTAVDWAERLLDLAFEPFTQRTIEHATSPVGSSEYVNRAREARAACREFREVLRTINEDFDVAKTRWGAWEEAPFVELQQWTDQLSQHATSAASWIEYRSAVRDLEGDLGEGACDRVRAVTDDAADVPGIVRRRVLGAWLDRIYKSEPALEQFTAKDQDDIRRGFQRLDAELVRAAQARVRQRCFERYPEQYTTHTRAGQIGILQGELSKRRRHMPVRRLLRRAPELIQALKPCFLMSPLAVSQYLPRGQDASESIEFDVVIFDEASQIFPEDAVPAIARAEYAIVAGDRKQLPPTSFFRHAVTEDAEPADEDEEEEQDSFEGRESILDVMVGMAGRNVAEQYLTVHYRSKHESLIRYSNHYFYDDRLLSFPAPEGDASHVGIRDVYLPDGRYDAAATRTNRREAEKVVDLVFDLMRTRPERESIGVVALSRAQADLIERLVEERRFEARDLDERFAEDRQERFFVKNLENVQGDERDHIILSIGYGPTIASGAVPNRFGPINAEGGQRRLNVAVSRARRSMTIVHSLRAADIVAQSEGARLLRRYLEYIRDPVGAFESALTVDPAAEPESPFEDEVRRALERRGHRVASQVGISGYRIDLAIASEDGAGYDLGVECDGATYHSAPAARDRDRQRQQVLEGLGWRLHRVWSTAWVRNADAEIAGIERALDMARAVKIAEDRSSLGDADNPARSESRRRPAPETGGAGDALSLHPRDPDKFFDEYQQASLREIPVGQELQSEVRDTMTQLIRKVAEVEGPVHVDIVVERIRDRYGHRRAGRLIKERIMRGLEDALKSVAIVRDGKGSLGQFIRIPGDDGVLPRRPPSGGAARAINHVANRELDAGLLIVAERMYGADRDDLVVETSRQFGYDRTGERIERRLLQAIERLEQGGLLRRQFGMLVVNSSALNT